MVRQVTSKQTPGFKALLVIIVAAAGLLWHLFACIESPMSFSPDGKDLAFVTMEPYGDESLIVSGTRAYRLMVLTQGKRLRVVEETTENMLSGPAYSPDGKHLCYLRIPLLSNEKFEELKTHIEKKKKQPDAKAEFQWAATPRSGAQTEDLTLPPLEGNLVFLEGRASKLTLPVTLVARDAATDTVVSETPVDIPLTDDPDHDLSMIYLLTRPQHSPDGERIYLCAGNVVMAVNPAQNTQRVLAAPVLLATLSPDGRTIATLQESSVGFIQTDGSKAVYRRLDTDKVSLGGLRWVDNNTVAIVRADGENKQLVLQRIGADGSLGKQTLLPLPEQDEKHNGSGASPKGAATIQWAISKDARYMTIVYGPKVFFTQTDGKLLGEWEGGDEKLLAQPTFTPDSERVAFKYITQEVGSYARVEAIVFFTPQGKELSRAPVPRIDPRATRPASRPTQENDE